MPYSAKCRGVAGASVVRPDECGATKPGESGIRPFDRGGMPPPPNQGHRIIEFAGLEMINRKLTGKHLHLYIHPDREIDPDAERPDDPALARLLPDAYADDDEASAEFRRFTERTLRETKMRAPLSASAPLRSVMPSALATMPSPCSRTDSIFSVSRPGLGPSFFRNQCLALKIASGCEE